MTTPVRALHDDMAPVIAEHLKGFVSKRADGALIGPFPPMLHFPQFGRPAWEYTKALIEKATLPKPVREVAILTVGAAFGARYALYAHESTAAEVGRAGALSATLPAGGRPSGLSDEAAVAPDVAHVLTRGHILPASTYARALELLGRDGVGELAFLVGGYCLLAMVLNAFDVPVPEAHA